MCLSAIYFLESDDKENLIMFTAAVFTVPFMTISRTILIQIIQDKNTCITDILRFNNLRKDA